MNRMRDAPELPFVKDNIRMKYKLLRSAFPLLGGISLGFCIPLFQSALGPGPDNSPKSELPYCTVSPSVPAEVAFAGESVDLTRADMRERMDRELTSFTYMHSTTMLVIKRSNRYFPQVEPILQEEGVPDDFKYLMAIESSLDPLARSPVKACGLWQFMESTGKLYGLEINANVDERYHLEKATRAACRYLKDAYAKYHDWLTVAASYNAGQGRITHELDRQRVEKATDLWLNQETSRYMFRILAMKEIFNEPVRYGFALKREQLYPQIPCKQVRVTSAIADLSAYARQHGLTVAQLKEANPWLRGYALHDKGAKEYLLDIPDAAALRYDPKETKAHNGRWVID